MVFPRKNQVYEFIPDRLPEFPIKKFEKVSGEAFFIDESLLVFIYFTLIFLFNTEILYPLLCDSVFKILCRSIQS